MLGKARRPRWPLWLPMALFTGPLVAHAADEDDNNPGDAVQLEALQVIGTAQEELKQMPGVSTITSEEIKKAPPTNDISEILRKQPGVNLTGNSGSGARGNNRQIDIRGMGPENTLILIDGKPATSRNSVRYGWRNDRDTRGDSNWVPPEQIDHIEVLRGPAAARYGSGAMGGVVNIITKTPTNQQHGKASIFANAPQHDDEGATRRFNFGLDGPLIKDRLFYRLYGNLNKTDSDDEDINVGHVIFADGTPRSTAGREGVRNRDINGLLSWHLDEHQRIDLEGGFSRQGNIYAGDSQTNTASENLAAIRDPWLGRETNIMYRENYALTHRGDWDFGSTLSYLQFERTRNHRLSEGLAGGTEGSIAGNDFYTTVLKNTTAHSELNLPFSWGFKQVATLGVEWTKQAMNDPASITQDADAGGSVPGIKDTNRPTSTSSRLASAFLEDNIQLAPGTKLTPELRFDHHSATGSNWGPALNLSHDLSKDLVLKAGVARAYKAPNLYQTNPNYLLFSRGAGCWGGGGSCYLQGNKNLDAETSINKELGLQFRRDGWVAGLTWFRNDYHDKIEAGQRIVGNARGGGNADYADADIFRWENIPRAVVEGVEGTITVPVADTWDWNTNFTYMLKTVNKETGEPLSVIPEYTLNSTLDWQINNALSTRATLTWYGKQKPPRYNGKGDRVSGAASRELSPYALAGLSATYEFSKHLSVTGGLSNLFDKRLYREGNSDTAGAYTYNEPGRTLYTSISTSF